MKAAEIFTPLPVEAHPTVGVLLTEAEIHRSNSMTVTYFT